MTDNYPDANKQAADHGVEQLERHQSRPFNLDGDPPSVDKYARTVVRHVRLLARLVLSDRFSKKLNGFLPSPTGVTTRTLLVDPKASSRYQASDLKPAYHEKGELARETRETRFRRYDF